MKLITERTKFYSEHDKLNYYSDVSREFIRLYGEQKSGAALKKVNLELLKEVNTYLDKYSDYQRLTAILYTILTKLGKDYKGYARSLIINKESVRKQRDYMLRIKVGLKAVPLQRKYINPLNDSVSKSVARIDRLLHNIVPVYVKETPIVVYANSLEEKGTTIIDDIRSVYTDLAFGEFEESEEVKSYVAKVVEVISNRAEWNESAQHYQQFLDKKYRMRKEEMEAAMDKRHAEKEQYALERLYTAAKQLGEHIDSGTHSCSDVRNILNRISDLGGGAYKLFLITSTQRDNAAIFYYNPGMSNGKCTGLGNAYIVRESDPVPEHLLEYCKRCHNVYAEVVVQ